MLRLAFMREQIAMQCRACQGIQTAVGQAHRAVLPNLLGILPQITQQTLPARLRWMSVSLLCKLGKNRRMFERRWQIDIRRPTDDGGLEFIFHPRRDVIDAERQGVDPQAPRGGYRPHIAQCGLHAVFARLGVRGKDALAHSARVCYGKFACCHGRHSCRAVNEGR